MGYSFGTLYVCMYVERERERKAIILNLNRTDHNRRLRLGCVFIFSSIAFDLAEFMFGLVQGLVWISFIHKSMALGKLMLRAKFKLN